MENQEIKYLFGLRMFKILENEKLTIPTWLTLYCYDMFHTLDREDERKVFQITEKDIYSKPFFKY